MKVFFVRHGESELNITQSHQHPNVQLSEKGKRQALALAKRLEKLSVDRIISSEYTRAFQTAEVISERLTIPITSSSLFAERRKPSVYEGKSVKDPQLADIKTVIRQNAHNPEWHYAEEENFYDLKARAQAALKFLSTQPWENIVVTSHRGFLFILVAEILLREKFDHDLYHQLDTTMKLSNTGIVICEYMSNHWKLLTWNDVSHLEDI